MFNNIGGKIKGLASFICWLGIIGSVLGGIVLMMMGDELGIILGIVVALVGSLISWIGSFLLYGFGQLIYNSDVIARNTQGGYNPTQFFQGVQPMSVAPGMQAVPVAHQWKCEGCGNLINKEICPFCGKPHGKAIERVATLQKLFSEGAITEEEYNSKLEKLRNE